MRIPTRVSSLELFSQEGFAAVSMRRLAQESGCTPMTLYKYFKNKFEILGMLWADVLGDLFDRLDRLAATESDPVVRLGAWRRATSSSGSITASTTSSCSCRAASPRPM